jgi:capsular exopolysaccharide synthesis family protein
MNRVDEALRRAREFTPILSDDDRIEDGPAARVQNPVPLDFYPPEEAASFDAVPEKSSAPSVSDEQGMVHVRQEQAFGSESAPAFTVVPRFGQAYDGRLIGNVSAAAFSTEQYRRLAAAVHHLQGEQGLHRLMVSSAVPREGKTLTIVNLAMTLAESYQRRVLLIDADLRKPSLHEVFGITNTDGLCEVLQFETGEVQLAQVSERLWVLPAGSVHGDPVQTLASVGMANLLNDLASQFDWILLDAPPVTVMADTGLLVRLTHAVLLVIGAGSTPYTVVEKAAAELGRENIVGTVLNRIDETPAKRSPYYVGFESAGASRRLAAGSNTPSNASSGL